MASRSIFYRSVQPVASSSRSFHSSPALLAGGKGPKKSNVVQAQSSRKLGFKLKRESKSASGGRGSEDRNSKLSILPYSLASEVPDLSDLLEFSPEHINVGNIGAPVTFPSSSFKALRSFGLPRQLSVELQSHGQPASIIRSQTLEMVQLLSDRAEQSSENGRYALVGPQGSGKSMLLYQTLFNAHDRGWIVIYVPRLPFWLDGIAPFGYNERTHNFDQPTIAADLLGMTLEANRSSLKRIPLSTGEGNLADLATRSLKNEEGAVEGLRSFMEELGKQKQIPVLLAMDDVQSLFSASRYKTPQWDMIESYHLSAPLLALDYLTGRKTFSRGAVVSAISYSLPAYRPSKSLEHGMTLPSRSHLNAYDKIDATHYAHASAGIQKLEVPFGFSTGEAGGLYQMWMRKGMVRQPTDEGFMGLFAASSGNPKEMKNQLEHTNYPTRLPS